MSLGALNDHLVVGCGDRDVAFFNFFVQNLINFYFVLNVRLVRERAWVNKVDSGVDVLSYIVQPIVLIGLNVESLEVSGFAVFNQFLRVLDWVLNNAFAFCENDLLTRVLFLP